VNFAHRRTVRDAAKGRQDSGESSGNRDERGAMSASMRCFNSQLCWSDKMS